MRPYERSHPWLSFQLDLRPASHRFWMLLGEAQSKCDHIAGVPLLPATAEALHRLYLAKGVLGTTAIEGNTLSEEQVLAHLDGKLELPASQRYLENEIANIVAACNEIGAALLVGGTDGKLSPELLKRWNERVLEGLPLDPEVSPGRVREHSVTAGRYRGAPAADCEYLLGRLCEWLNELAGGLELNESESTCASALLRAILGHLYFVWIHPFGDGNGRTARLLEFHILVGAGLPTPVAHLLSNHYNETRSEYYRQLDRASAAGGDVLPFIEYAVRGFVEGMRGQLERIRGQQWAMTFDHFVHDRFAARISPADLRQRDLVLDLAQCAEPVPLAQIPLLTPRLAKAYAGKTRKTLTRDVNAVVTAGLVERKPSGLRARREDVLAFLPQRRVADRGEEQR
jgi:Fic family protein